jgi:acyl-CoA thioester hydrolase
MFCKIYKEKITFFYFCNFSIIKKVATFAKKIKMELKFKHSIPVQLRFNDADSLGHINNTVYFSFYDLGKSEYFKAVKGSAINPKEVDIVVAHAEVDFFAPIFLSDEIAVQTTVSDIGNKSLTLVQRIVETNTNIIKCICKTIMVGFDLKTQSSKPISDEWRKAIFDFEDIDFFVAHL